MSKNAPFRGNQEKTMRNVTAGPRSSWVRVEGKKEAAEVRPLPNQFGPKRTRGPWPTFCWRELVAGPACCRGSWEMAFRPLGDNAQLSAEHGSGGCRLDSKCRVSGLSCRAKWYIF